MEYLKDGRLPIDKIYSSCSGLTNFKKEVIFYQLVSKHKFPILCFKSKKKGKAIWLISGIHGEEPAGVNALSLNIDFLNKLAGKIPMVILPLCNPKGYFLNWRYPSRKTLSKNSKLNKSVATAEHLLIDVKNKFKPRLNSPETIEAEKICSHVIKILDFYPPLFMLDLHEDDCNKKAYTYSQGKFKNKNPIAQEIVAILSKHFPIELSGKTEFNEKIKKGVIFETIDGSIDELFSAGKIIVNKKAIKKPAAKSVVVVETPSLHIPLAKRVLANSSIIQAIPQFIKLAKSI